jgi:hypothetical protein
MPLQNRFRRCEVGVTLGPARAGKRVLMPRRSVCRTTLRTLFAGPRFRPDFDRDAVFLSGRRQPLGELIERPEIMCLGVHPD